MYTLCDDVLDIIYNEFLNPKYFFTNEVLVELCKVLNPNVSGFKKNAILSDDIIKFTGWDHRFGYTRLEVTIFLCEYIKSNELQNMSDRRKIILDETLKHLLKCEKDEITYWELQKYIAPHIGPNKYTRWKKYVDSMRYSTFGDVSYDMITS